MRKYEKTDIDSHTGIATCYITWNLFGNKNCQARKEKLKGIRL